MRIRPMSVTLAPCELRVVNLKADTARFADGLRPLAENPAPAAPLIRFANDALWDDEAQAFVLPRF